MKNYKIIFWITTIIILLMEAVMPLSTIIFAPEYVNAGTKPLGYPDYFAYSLIIFKILGATALVIPILHPKLKEWAYAGLMYSLIFAVISHLAVDKNIAYILMPILVGIILAVSYVCNQKIIKNT
jgi:uncharacterized membrane protein YphA (DoxX/SURF4 family)